MVTLVVVLLGCALYFHNPDVLSTADIHAERISVDVVDARKAAFYIAGVKIGAFGGNEPSACLSGLFTPARGTAVSYGRVGKGPLEITLTPIVETAGLSPAAVAVGSFEPAGGKPAMQYRGTTLIVTDERCNPPTSQRLPFWGHLRVGQEFRPASGSYAPEPSFLLSGKLEVAAHAIWTGTLYQVTSVTLPAGGRLQTNAREQRQNRADQAVWWGTATVDPDHVALDVVAATEAPSLALYRPNRTQADRIELSTLTQLTADPTIVKITFIFGIVVFVLSSCAALAGLWHEHEKERHEKDHARTPPV